MSLADDLAKDRQYAETNWLQYQLIGGGMEQTFRRDVSSTRARMAAAGVRVGSEQWNTAMGADYARYEESLKAFQSGATGEILDAFVEGRKTAYTRAADPSYLEYLETIWTPVYEDVTKTKQVLQTVPGTGQYSTDWSSGTSSYIPIEHEWVTEEYTVREFTGVESEDVYWNPYREAIKSSWYSESGMSAAELQNMSRSEFLTREFGRSDALLEGRIGLLDGYANPAKQTAGRRAAARSQADFETSPWI